MTELALPDALEADVQPVPPDFASIVQPVVESGAAQKSQSVGNVGELFANSALLSAAESSGAGAPDQLLTVASHEYTAQSQSVNCSAEAEKQPAPEALPV